MTGAQERAGTAGAPGRADESQGGGIIGDPPEFLVTLGRHLEPGYDIVRRQFRLGTTECAEHLLDRRLGDLRRRVLVARGSRAGDGVETVPATASAHRDVAP